MAETSKTKTKTSSKKKTTAKKKRKKLVIVESPSKASTIKKYLGRNYDVMASVGHIIDLPKSRLGVDLESFDPDYIVMRDKSKVMKELRKAAKNAEEVILASDPDREGEAIAWHIRNDLTKRVVEKIKRRDIPIKRIRFEEITKQAVQKAIEEPREINDELVQAQQGRRVIDRLFGYQLSPLLWKKVKSKLSAGRVQSVALRIICEREEQIEKFKPLEYWTFGATLLKGKASFEANLVKMKDLKLASPGQEHIEILKKGIEAGELPVALDEKNGVIADKKSAEQVEKELRDGEFNVVDMREKQIRRKPTAPFITSTLQQTANNLLGFTSMRTMRVAQGLYEGVDLGKTRTGLITYMRTDSTRISPIAMTALRDYIKEEYGEKFLEEKERRFKNKKSAQDAHEAIRPTDVTLHPDEIKEYLSKDQYKLYDIIWRRYVASQMTVSLSKQLTVEVENGDKTLTATASELIFPGWLKVFTFSKSKKDKKLPKNLKTGDTLELKELTIEEKYTEPPARYTDASLVKKMEELGIGRPSTYAPTIYTLTKRYYVTKEGKSLIPTELGRVVNDLLVKHFPGLINVNFTANMEEELDEVEEGKKEWKSVVKDFYGPFSKVLNDAYENIDEIKGIFDEPTDYTCEKCGKPMVKKLGRYGYFMACSGWPDCRNTKPLPLGQCPQCEDGQVVAKKGKKGRPFYGCNRYPECDFATYNKPSKESCPNDGAVLFHKKEKGQQKLVCLKEGCGYEKELE